MSKSAAFLNQYPVLHLLQDSFDPPLTATTLDALQGRLGKKLPHDYAEFLLEFNGGYFTRIVEFPVAQPTRFVPGAMVRYFVGEPNDGSPTDGLVSLNQYYRDKLPSDYLIIAECNDTDQLLLKLVGDESRLEGVWYWDSAVLPSSREEQSLYWVAESFRDFLTLLIHNVCWDRDEVESIPAFQSIERGAFTAIEDYLTEGGDTEARNEHGHTLLMAACRHRWPKIAQVLLARSANPNARDSQGKTPLHHAAMCSVDCVKLLLAAGADVTARDHSSKSVISNWEYRCDRILKAHGAPS